MILTVASVQVMWPKLIHSFTTLSGLVFFRFCQSVYLLYDLFDSVTTLPHHIVKMVEVLHFAEVT